MARKRRRKLKLSVKITMVVLVVLLAGSIFGYYEYQEYLNSQEKIAGKISESKDKEDKDEPIDEEEEDDDSKKFTYKIYDAGKGECILIKSGEDVVLIDTGSKDKSKEVATKIEEDTAGEINYLILTSNTKERTGGAKAFAKQFKIKNVILGEFGQDEEKYRKIFKNSSVKNFEEDDVIYMNNSAVISPYMPEGRSDDIKDKSIITITNFANYTFYAGSDAGVYEEKRMLNELYSTTVSVFVLAQRGAVETNALLKEISPGYLIASRDKDEKLDKKIIDRTDCSRIYSTGTCGDIEFTVIDNNMTLKDEDNYDEKGYNLADENGGY